MLQEVTHSINFQQNCDLNQDDLSIDGHIYILIFVNALHIMVIKGSFLMHLLTSC